MRPALPAVALLTLSLLGPAPAFAGGSGYARDLEGRCQVWAPSMLNQRDYVLRYRGGCEGGRAEGDGQAEWLYRYADLRVKASWEGQFRNGVFLDGQKVKGRVTPVDGDRYVVEMGALDGAGLFFISTSPQDAPMDLCRVESVGLVLRAGIAPADDARVRRVVESAGKAYRAACPKAGRDVLVGVHTQAIEPRSNGMLPNPMARATYHLESGELSGYSNEASSKAREEQRQAEWTRKQDDARARFREFSRKHRIASWVTVQQLDENPFRWEGKAVGVVVRLERMATRDSALVESGLRGWGPSVVLTGVTPGFPGSQKSVLAAVTVGKREPLPGGGDRAPSYLTLRHLESRTCERSGCGEWFIWVHGDEDLAWGEPYRDR